MKRCSKCSKTKPLDAFSRQGASKDGLAWWCKACANSYNATYSAKPASKAREAAYRITPAVKERRAARRADPAVKAQKATRNHGEAATPGACDNCGEFGPRVVDHDHACCPGDRSCAKCRRGLLCQGCNRGLGGFRDNPQRLLRAVTYLANPPGVHWDQTGTSRA